MTFEDIGKFVVFLAALGAVYAIMFLIHYFFGGWGVAVYIAAIVIGVTWWCERHPPFMKRRKPNRWEDLELPEYED